MIPKSRSLVLDRLNAENIEKIHDRHLFDFIDVHRLTVLVDDELHADAKLRVEMSRAVAPNKPFLNGSGQSYCIRQVYFRFQCHGTAIDKRSLVLQGRSVQGTGCRNACCRYASPCACKKSKRPTTSYLSTCWVACRVTCWVLVGYLLGQGTKKSELWGNCMTTMG